MTVVTNTSPLNYLLLIGEARVLPPLFGLVHLPGAVVAELSAPAATEAVRAWAAAPPDWACLHTVSPAPLTAAADLHPGETEAILLAIELRADLLLMDELDGRAAARAVGLKVIGTLGVLELAAVRGLLDFRGALQRLRPPISAPRPGSWPNFSGAMTCDGGRQNHSEFHRPYSPLP